MTKIFKKRSCVFKNFRKESVRAHAAARCAPDQLPAPGHHLYIWLLWNYFGPSFRCGQISYCGEDCLVKDSARHRTFCGISLKDMF